MGYHLTPADYIIKKFGGVRKTAKMINRSAASVSKWSRATSRDGHRGLIPSTVMPKILDVAKKNDLDITAENLILGGKA